MCPLKCDAHRLRRPHSLLFRDLPPGVKRPGREGDHSPPSVADVKNSWSYTSTPPTRLHVGTRATLPALRYTYFPSLSLRQQRNSAVCFPLSVRTRYTSIKSLELLRGAMNEKRKETPPYILTLPVWGERRNNCTSWVKRLQNWIGLFTGRAVMHIHRGYSPYGGTALTTKYSEVRV